MILLRSRDCRLQLGLNNILLRRCFMSTLLLRKKYSFIQFEAFLSYLLFVFVGSMVLALSAQISLPLYPVPITLQTSTVLILGVLFEPKISGGIVITYILEGMLGLPVFANFSCGIPILFGVTGGYLWGFLPAIMLVGYFKRWNLFTSLINIFFAITISTAVIFVFGYMVLVQFVGYHSAFIFGIAPFYLTELCKIIALTALVSLFQRWML
jgi:biotin transport system substrate-specific component